jgi:hypothetical protein
MGIVSDPDPELSAGSGIILVSGLDRYPGQRWECLLLTVPLPGENYIIKWHKLTTGSGTGTY